MNRIGVDPGLSGALAWVWGDPSLNTVVDMPTVSVKRNGKNKKDIDYERLGQLLSLINIKTTAYIEKVGSMPGQGLSSTFAFGKATGAVIGSIATLLIPFTEVSPISWKKHFGLTGKNKDAARLLAIEKFPNLANQLKRKKDCGRADALLIAEYGRLVLSSPD